MKPGASPGVYHIGVGSHGLWSASAALSGLKEGAGMEVEQPEQDMGYGAWRGRISQGASAPLPAFKTKELELVHC